MKKVFLLMMSLPFLVQAQQPIIYPGGFVPGNTTFTLKASDSLTHSVAGYSIKIDTTSSGVWQIGNSLKPVFSNDTTPSRGIMTDTLHPYPHNANDYFVLKIGSAYNCIVDIWHRYETHSQHAGGIVEFSTDGGSSWLNVLSCPMIGLQNYYAATDTLLSGQPSFTGTSSGQQLSRVQFLNCMAIRTTSTICFPNYSYMGGIYLRFRFLSDSTVDSLSGWKIDSIEVEYPGCGEGVRNVQDQPDIAVFPNPASTTLTILAGSGLSPAGNKISQVAISNLLGQTVFTRNYNSDEVEVDVADLPTGLYMLKINGAEMRKFVKD